MRTVAFACGALSAWTVPAIAEAQAVPQFLFSVRNNTSVALTCDFKHGGSEAETIELAPGAEWRDRAETETTVAEIACRPPVRQVLYRVMPGDRYAFLRNNAQARVKLRRITVVSQFEFASPRFL